MLKLKNDGSIIVKAPFLLSKKTIDAFVQKNRAWIEQKQAELGPVTKRDFKI